MIQEKCELGLEELAAEEVAELPDREELSLLLPPTIGGGGAMPPLGRDAGSPLPTGQAIPTQSLPASPGVPQLGRPLPG
jgi:hypothetical protein